MSTSSKLMLRASAAAGTVAVLMASGAGMLLFASPAAADVSGYQTGYSYHQGLAIGAGGQLMAQSGSAAANTGTTNAVTSQTAAPSPTVTSQATAPNTAPAAQPQAQSVVAPTTQSAPAVTTAPAPVTPAASAFAGIVTPIAWAVLVVALLALIAGGIYAANRETADEQRIRRTTTYRRTT